MKICVDAREFTGKGRTGIGRYLENLVAPLTGHSDLEWVLLVSRADVVPQRLRAPSVKPVEIPAFPTLLNDQFLLQRLAVKEGADVFFSPYYKSPTAGRFRRIITVHDIMFLKLPGLSPARRFIVGRRLRASCRRADVILADSVFSKKDLAEFAPDAADKIRVLHPDLSEDWTVPSAPERVEAARKKYADGRPFFLYVGNFKPHKNVGVLASAFVDGLAKGRLNDRCLLLVGGDPRNTERIEAAIAGESGRAVRIWRDVPDDDLRCLYTAADWFVTASSYEGFGYPILEAMACGCPVICHPGTSIPEVTGPAFVGIESLTRDGIGNALCEAAALSSERRHRLSEEGRIASRRFRPGSAAAEFRRALGI